MEQDQDAGGFVPRSFDDLLRPDAAASATETAGRPEPEVQTAAPVETGEATTPPAEPSDGRLRDPATGKFVPKPGEAQAPQATGSPPAEQQAPQMVPASALVEERRKWQARVKELEARSVAPPAPPPVQHQPTAPEVPLEDLLFQDPRQFVATMQRQHEEALLQTRIAASEVMARQNADYPQAEAALEAYARQGERQKAEVVHLLRNHPAPALAAYQAGKQLLARQKWQPVMQQHPDPEAYIAAEVERRLAERAPVAAPASSPASQPPPTSLASVRSAAPRSGASPWSGPAPTAAVFGRK